ncbi:sulfur carrier protein ThiS [Lichenibacterium dinghuense]|uniref:sulfur carrier protein ThiS n=1 Tax=Lichenibacterium dinghuense TaxID=2895977 RepID=UPI001F012B96|nr:sulfur carrier protein ThiS [Lichenibacterium sp. 6Y81]
MRLTVNGEARDTEARNLAALWAAETAHLRVPTDAGAWGSTGDEAAGEGAPAPAGAPEPPSRRGFAIALNGEVVRAARWDDTRINEGDRVEIIRAVAGG